MPGPSADGHRAPLKPQGHCQRTEKRGIQVESVNLGKRLVYGYASEESSSGCL